MDRLTTQSQLLLVRHTAVADRYQDVCYGSSDVELSPAGKFHAKQLVLELSERPIERVIHSGLQRTRYLAQLLADRLSLPLVEEPRIRERDFGLWELRPWSDIYHETGDDMLKMISEPETFRPGGAETTNEFSRRVREAIAQIESLGLTVVIAHGGPIAALRGMQAQKSIADWLSLIPAHGECIPYPLSNGGG